MAEYPTITRPGWAAGDIQEISAPSILDPIFEFKVDQGYGVRRSKHSRPRRRYTITYPGIRTDEYRTLRAFFYATRLSALPFSWVHATGIESTVLLTGTPMLLWHRDGHALATGQWVVISNAEAGPLNTYWQVTTYDRESVALNGSSAAAGGPCNAQVYLPRAILVAAQDTWEAPSKHIGPERGVDGYWALQVTIEEIF